MNKTPVTKPKARTSIASSTESLSSSEDESTDNQLKLSVAQLAHAIELLNLPDLTVQHLPDSSFPNGISSDMIYPSFGADSADKYIQSFLLMLLHVRLESYSHWPHNKEKETSLDPLFVYSWFFLNTECYLLNNSESNKSG